MLCFSLLIEKSWLVLLYLHLPLLLIIDIYSLVLLFRLNLCFVLPLSQASLVLLLALVGRRNRDHAVEVRLRLVKSTILLQILLVLELCLNLAYFALHRRLPSPIRVMAASLLLVEKVWVHLGYGRIDPYVLPLPDVNFVSLWRLNMSFTTS